VNIMSTLDAPAQSHAVSLSRQAILDATAQAMAEVGYDGTTIRKIASLLNCAVGSIYRYFTDKRQLLLAVAEQRLDGVVAVIEAGGSFEQSVHAYVDAVLEEPETYRMMFWLSCLGRAGQQQPLLPAAVTHVIENWGRRLGDAQLARQAWTALHGSIMLDESRPQMLAAVHRVLNGSSMRSIAPPPTPQPKPTVMLQAPIRLAAPVPQNEDVCLL